MIDTTSPPAPCTPMPLAAPPLASVAELRAALGQPGWVVLDASFDLQDAQAGRRAFEAGHVPGARYAHLDEDLCGTKTGGNGRHPLPEREAFARTVGRWGIGPETVVIVLDRQGAMFAARLWWMLRWLGHERVAVLDGGWAAWQAEAGTVETGASGPVHAAVDRVPYPPRPSLERVVSADVVRARLGQIPLIDARAPERYRGEVEPLDARAGHIPGAVNRFFQLNLLEGHFKPASVLRADFEALLGGAAKAPEAVIHSCGSGVTACHNLLAMHVAGLPGAALYAGSWSEWSADPARPVAVGAQ